MGAAQGRSIMTTQVIFIEVLANKKFDKKVDVSVRVPEVFCKAAAEYYKKHGFETEVRQSKKDKRFYGVFSKRNDKIMAVAGPEQNDFFWAKHTTIKQEVNEANGGFIRPKGQNKNFYAIVSPEFTGFVLTWTQCEAIVKGKSAKYKGFNGLEAAKAWMRENHAADASFEHITDIKQIK